MRELTEDFFCVLTEADVEFIESVMNTDVQWVEYDPSAYEDA